MEFDICFYRSQKIFEVTPKKSAEQLQNTDI